MANEEKVLKNGEQQTWEHEHTQLPEHFYEGSARDERS